MNTLSPLPTPATAAPASASSRIKAPSAILMSPPGGGKSWSTVTWLMAGIEAFVIITEPNGLDSLLDCIRTMPDPNREGYKVPRPGFEKLMSLLHYHEVKPKAAPWKDLMDTSRKVGLLTYKDLKSSASPRGPDVMLDLLQACNDFPDDLSGKKFGDVSTWGDNRVLIIDSLSGLNDIVRQLVIGHHPAPDKSDYQVMINQEQTFLYTLQSNCYCFFVVYAHVNRGNDELTGQKETTPAAMSYSYSGKVGKDFSEVILAKRVGTKFLWSTMELNTDIKNRALPISDNLPPDWGQLITVHRARVAASKAA